MNQSSFSQAYCFCPHALAEMADNYPIITSLQNARPSTVSETTLSLLSKQVTEDGNVVMN